MRKTILTTVIALFCLSASAQFRVMSSVNTSGEGSMLSVDSITNNLGFGYQVSDDVMVGFQKNGDDYDFVARYSLTDDMYLSVQAPTENTTDNMTLGVGTSIKLWEELYIEPNYTTTDGEGSFNVGLSYKL
tara:strand:- start:283 stop:675 length:393 start_codon:yes stop_codon:yes gene_type:complete